MLALTYRNTLSSVLFNGQWNDMNSTYTILFVPT